MPKFYSVQNADGLLPAFEPRLHLELPLFLVILPAAAFALLSVGYGLIKLKAPAIELLKGKSSENVKPPKSAEKPTFLREMKSATVRSRKSLVFFIGFAAFCYSAMVQMSLGMDKLASEMMSLMTLMIGVILAFVTLFIALSAIVRSNAKSVSIMRVFGYSERECSRAVLSGYRPAAVIGFIVGSAYQYLLLKIAVEIMFKDVDNIPKLNFDFRALIIASVSFVAVYEAVMRIGSRKLGKISLKKIMLDNS